MPELSFYRQKATVGAVLRREGTFPLSTGEDIRKFPASFGRDSGSNREVRWDSTVASQCGCEPAVAVADRIRELTGEIAAWKREAAEADWNGERAHPLCANSAEIAERLGAMVIRERLPMPEVGVTPMGHMILDWYPQSSWCFTVSVSADGRLHYSGLFDGEEMRGMVPALRDEIPSAILAGIERASERMTE